ncbi:hypothetical protein FJ973_29715 [Mesorhizobium sp. B2-1-3]|uniref:hypothetical protein n=1 Tax=Mesorhizobium sp. B2-1-3 TaxID=2589972 RepID=UPI0011270E26|nr:hypothetical protein [Mesorhizobium sp. B2-1-3]TPN03822.1 hypothetical protein FJ973_29715 [Mesorhizobium sp. B2-1-3]
MSEIPKAPAWVGITYLIYSFMVWGLCIGGTGYAVFVLGYSGWWFVLGFFLASCGYSPWRWHSIWTGVEVPMNKFGPSS